MRLIFKNSFWKELFHYLSVNQIFNRLKNIFIFLFSCIIFISCNDQKLTKTDVKNDIVNPKTYVVYKTTSSLIIDGKADDLDWKNTSFTENFIDIEGVKTPKQITKIKMLWDVNYLYIYAKLEEKHIWGDITKRDAVIFYNNDFEVFISPVVFWFSTNIIRLI